jgi:hypothetical protein
LERNMLNRIMPYILCNKLLYHDQYAYQKNSSIIQTLISKTDFIYSAFNSSKAVLAIYLDLSRAFETVCHPLLLYKLLKLGFSSKSLSLVNNYLSNRCQMTIINNSISDILSLETGLPQGTILAPWFFILFLNDLFSVKTCGHTLCYADDTILLFELNRKTLNITDSITDSVCKVNNWFNDNLLIINGKKSNFTIFNQQTYNLPQSLHIKIGNNCLFYLETPKYLGLLFDTKLQWNIQINKMLIKTKFMTKQAHYLSKILSFKNKLIWYYAFVFSYVSQYAQFISTSSKNQYNKLSISHGKILKALFKQNIKQDTRLFNTKTSNGTNIQCKITYISGHCLEEFMKKNNLLNLQQIASYNIINSIQKMKIHNNKNNLNNNNDLNDNMTKFSGVKFNSMKDLNSCTTRSIHNKLIVPFYIKTSGQLKYDYRAAEMYNKIPDNIITISNIKLFKLKLKSYLLGN